MAWLGDLLVRLKAETADFQQDMGRAALIAERSFRRIQNAQNALLGALGTGGAIAFSKQIVDATVEAEKASTRQNALLQATNHYAGMARDELEAMAVSMSRATTFDDTSIRNAQSALIQFGNITAPVFERAMRASADLAATMGTNIPEAAQIVGKALQSPTEGFRGLAQQFGKLEQSELSHIEALAKSGDALKTQAAVLAFVESRVKDVAGAMNTGMTGATRSVAKEWNGLLEDLGKTESFGGGALIFFEALRDLLRDIRLIVTGKGGDSNLAGMLRELGGSGTANWIFGKQSQPNPSGMPTPRQMSDEEFRSALAAQQARADAIFKKPKLGGQFGLKPEQELKMFTSAMQALEKQYFNLTNAGQAQLLVYETTKGTLKDLTAAHKGELVEMARKVDLYQRELELREAGRSAIAAEVAARVQTQQIVREQVFGNRQMLEDLEFQSTLIGKSAREQELMNAARQADLEIRRQLAALPRIEEGASPEALAENARATEILRARAEEHKAVFLEGIRARQEAERGWLTGAKDAFNEYYEAATNMARQTHDLFTNAFKGMEDALVKFVKTGKLDFKSLADSIVSDLIRIQIQREIMAPLVGTADKPGFLSQGMSALMGMLPSFDTGTGYVPRDMVAKVHQGEAIIPASQNRAGGGVNIVQNIHVDSRSDMASVAAAMRHAKDAAVGEIMEMTRRS